jgi:hypothetical protein
VLSIIHNEKPHGLQDHNVQTSKAVFSKSFLGLKFHLVRIFQKKRVCFVACAT